MNEGKSKPKSHRILELEGLRGIAAIVVVLFHVCSMFYPSVFSGPGAYLPTHHIHFEDNLFAQPFMGLLNGRFSVAIFFVLSGFVLSVGYFSTGKLEIVKKLAAKRYLRLMIPALVSVLIVWLTIALGLGVYQHHAGSITQTGWLAVGVVTDTPNFGDALWQGLVGIFQGSASYNPALWTMHYELIGSFVIFGVIMLFGNNRFRWLLYAGLCLGLINSWFLGFMFGMILADLYGHKIFPFNGRTNDVVVYALVAVAVALGGYQPDNGMYRYIKVDWFTGTQNEIMFLAIAAAVVVSGVLSSNALRKFFASKYVSGLGKYTFSLYLMHLVVLYTVCAGLFAFGVHHLGLGYNKAFALSFVITVPVLALVTYWFEKYVDAPSIRLSGKFSHWVLGLPQKDADPTFSAYSDNPSVGSTQTGVIARAWHRVTRAIGRGRAWSTKS